MNLQRIYDEFIRSRRERETTLERYERHHVIPRCLGGDDSPENIIRLLPEEHLFVHILLAKIHGGKLAVSAVRMLGMRKYAGRKSRLQYRCLRDKHRIEVSKTLKGIKRSEEFCEKRRRIMADPEVRKKVFTPLSAQRKSEAGRGKPKPPGFSDKVKEAWKDEKVRAARLKGVIGRECKPETRLKRSQKNKGRKPTDEELVKMRRPRSEEAKANMKRAAIERERKKRCQKTG